MRNSGRRVGATERFEFPAPLPSSKLLRAGAAGAGRPNWCHPLSGPMFELPFMNPWREGVDPPGSPKRLHPEFPLAAERDVTAGPGPDGVRTAG